MKSSIVSIITPSYNQGKYLSGTIASVLSQKGDFYIDYIIIDGASTDNSVGIIKEYEGLLKNNCGITDIDGLRFYVPDGPFGFNQCRGISYRWVSEKDRNQSHAINKGLKRAAGNIIAWLNSDDRYTDTGVLEIITDQFNRHHVKLCYAGAIAMDAEGKEMFRYLPRKVDFFHLFYVGGVPQPSVFFDRDVLDRVGLLREELRYCMDYDYWYRCMFEGFTFKRINRYLSIQIYHPDSKSCEGSYLLEAFQPELEERKQYYRDVLRKKSIAQYYYYIIKNLVLKLLRPIFLSINKIIGLIRRLVSGILSRVKKMLLKITRKKPCI